MKIIIDADGCPVVSETVSAAEKYHTECITVSDTAHEFHYNHVKNITVDKRADSADYKVANLAEHGDLVITQDYGLASMCLAKKAIVLHQDGWEYTEDNIDALLLERHEARKLRAAKKRTSKMKKRTEIQDREFITALEKILQTSVQG